MNKKKSAQTRHYNQLHDKSIKPFRNRERAPKMSYQGNKMLILCPYCNPPHPIEANRPAPCGTLLRITASQELYRNVSCALCKKNDEVLVRVGSLFRHVHECSPGLKLYAIPPKPAFSARLAFLFPKPSHLIFVKLFGKLPVRLSRDGKVVGFVWETAGR